jgi:hypothetical protein
LSVSLFLAQKPGAMHPDASSTKKHWHAFAFVRPKSADKFKPPVLREVADSRSYDRTQNPVLIFGFSYPRNLGANKQDLEGQPETPCDDVGNEYTDPAQGQKETFPPSHMGKKVIFEGTSHDSGTQRDKEKGRYDVQDGTDHQDTGVKYKSPGNQIGRKTQSHGPESCFKRMAAGNAGGDEGVNAHGRGNKRKTPKIE